MIIIILSIFIFLYIPLWKIEEVPLAHKIFYGAFFIPLTFVIFFAILYHLIADYSLTLVIYLFIFTQLTLTMLSDAGGDETVRKFRYGRMVLYSIGLGIGIIGIVVLFVIIFINILVLGISSLSYFYVDRVIIFGICGTIIFIFSVWGIAKEEQYGTGGVMKGSALFYANMMAMILFFCLTCIGLFSILDLLLWQQSYLQNNPQYNYIVGVSYFPIGLILLILSILKLRRDYRYRKQFY